MIKGRVVIIAFTALVLAAGGGAAFAALAPTSITTKKSVYLAGYADIAKSGAARAYRYVTATFKVPKIDCSSYSANGSDEVYFLAALNTEGTNAQTMVGAGVYARCESRFRAEYYATVSNAAFGFGCYGSDGEQRPYRVSPGDTIFASAYFNDTDNKFTYKVTDETMGRSHQETDPTDYGAGIPPTSAEVVAFGNTNNPDECGGGGVSYFGTPDFGTVTFTQIKVTDSTQSSGKTMNNAAFHLNREVMYGPKTKLVDAQPGTLYNDIATKPYHSRFAVTWRRSR